MTLLVLLLLQGTREAVYSSDPVPVAVPVSGPEAHRATVVTFPERSLEALVAGWSESDLSVERRGANLFIKLLRPAEGDLHVLGSSGRLYRLAVRPAEGAYDGHIRIRLPEAKKRGFSSAVQLIRAMRRNRRPTEGTVRRASEQIHVDGSLRATVARVYEIERYRGFVVEVQNTSARTRRIDPSRFTGRNLVLIGAREYVLKPGGRTALYLIFWKGP